MMRRMIAMAAACAAVILAGAHPALAAGQCEAACDKSFQTCNGNSADTSACLPKWGQCKRACSPPKAAPAAVKTTTTTTTAKVTKVATSTVKAKPKN